MSRIAWIRVRTLRISHRSTFRQRPCVRRTSNQRCPRLGYSLIQKSTFGDPWLFLRILPSCFVQIMGQGIDRVVLGMDRTHLRVPQTGAPPSQAT
jgi:hypothetical protein